MILAVTIKIEVMRHTPQVLPVFAARAVQVGEA